MRRLLCGKSLIPTRLQVFVEADAIPERVDDLDAFGIVKCDYEAGHEPENLLDELLFILRNAGRREVDAEMRLQEGR